MAVTYSLELGGVLTELTSKPKHVGHAGERELLLALFEISGGKSYVDPKELRKLGKEPESFWRKTGGWDPAVEPSWHHEYVCAFYGVVLADSGHVAQLRLGANGLTGEMPGRMLRGLPRIQVLDLSDNNLRGGLPSDLTFQAWTSLTHLVLSDNPHLGGSLPASLPQSCTALVRIQLHNCGLEGPLPPGLLSALPALQALLVHDNRLTGASPLTLFQGEDAGGGGGGDDDDGFAALLAAQAAAAAMGGGPLSPTGGGGGGGDPAMFASPPMSPLSPAGAGAGFGGGTGGGQARKRASTVKKKARAGKPMAETLEHRGLTRLSLHGNALSGPLGVLSAFTKLRLKHLSLGSNQFTGPVDPLLARWVASRDQRVGLVGLGLERNHLSGRFPTHLAAVRFTLRHLNLAHNRLTGGLPAAQLGQLTVLERLVLSHNNFTGKIPNTLSALATSLEQLVLGHNALTGDLPTEALGTLTKLRTLDLQRNRLRGEVGTFFKRMQGLRELNLGFNELSGPMPLASLGRFQRHQPAARRLKVCVLQPNPRMEQPSPEAVGALRAALPTTNVTVAWKSYTC